MFATVIFLIALLWLVLAVAVGSHARGHNRSGIVWFGIVLITGIFGLAFYFLSITSASSGEGEPEIGGRSLDQKIITKGPKYALCAVFGAIGVFLVGYIWAEIASGLTRPPLSQEGIPISPLKSLVAPIMFFSLLTGAVAGPLVTHKYSMRKFGYLLTYVPAIVIGMLGTLFAFTNLTGLGAGDFYGGPLILVPPLVELVGGVAGIVVWKRVYHSAVRPAVRSFFYTQDETGAVSPSRRRVLGLTGGGFALAIGGIAYRGSRPELRIASTKGVYDSGDPVVVVEMANPRSESVTVEIHVGIWNAEKNHYTDEVKTATISPESKEEVRIHFADTDIGRGFEVDDDPSFEEV